MNGLESITSVISGNASRYPLFDYFKLNKTHNKIHQPVSIKKGHVCLYTLIMRMFYILLLQTNQINKCICSSYTHNLKIGIENLKQYRMYSVKFVCEWIRKCQTLEVSEPSTHFVHLCIVQHFKSSELTLFKSVIHSTTGYGR